MDARRERAGETSGDEQAPIVYERGEGPNVVDVDGNRYVDLAAGFGALLLGHVPARVAEALDAQERRLWLALGDVYAAEAKVALCERLVAALSGARRARDARGERRRRGDGGAEDAPCSRRARRASSRSRAATTASRTGRSRRADCARASASRSPSSSTRTSCSRRTRATRRRSRPPWRRSSARSRRGDVGAVLVEPILGRGGCVVPPAAFLPALRDACAQSGALLVCDEIWTGLGRSGAWLASVEAGVVPDLVCLGKGLGGGLPISACIGRGERDGGVGRARRNDDSHRDALRRAARLRRGARDARRARRRGPRRRARARSARGGRTRLRSKLEGCGVAEVRGRGLMVGVELEGGAARALAVTRRLLQRGWIVLTGGAAGDVLTLTPPLDIDEALLDAFADALAASGPGRVRERPRRSTSRSMIDDSRSAPDSASMPMSAHGLRATRCTRGRAR